MKRSTMKYTSIALAVVLISSNLVGCKSSDDVRKPIKYGGAAYENVNRHKEELEQLIDKDGFTIMISEIEQMMIYRYEPFNIDSYDFKYLDEAFISKFKELTMKGADKYYNVETIYKEDYNNVVEKIRGLGGDVDIDGNIIFDDETRAKVFVEHDIDYDSIDRDAEDFRWSGGTSEEYDKYKNDSNSTEILEDDTIYELELDENGIPYAPYVEDEDNIEEDITDGNIENDIEESIEDTEIEESIESNWVSDSSQAIIYTGNIEIGIDEYGYPIDENGHVVIYGYDGYDPRTVDVWNHNGECTWKAVSATEAENLSDEENRKFLSAWYDSMNGNEEQRKAAYNQAEEIIEKNSQESKSNVYEGTEVDVDTETFVEKIRDLDNINKLYSSSVIEVVNGEHVISLLNIMNSYSINNGKFEFTILGNTHDINVSDIKIPIDIEKGNKKYDFKDVDFRLLSNGKILIFFESYYENGEKALNINVMGTVREGKFTPDNIYDFTNLYR